jgi:hypothetical protein
MPSPANMAINDMMVVGFDNVNIKVVDDACSKDFLLSFLSGFLYLDGDLVKKLFLFQDIIGTARPKVE